MQRRDFIARSAAALAGAVGTPGVAEDQHTCELAGVPVPAHVEFPSLTPMLRSEEPKPLYDCMFGWLEGLQRSVRTRDHKLIFYPRLDRYQLFDLGKDPWEMHDLVEDPAYADVKASMIVRLHRMQAELGDPMVLAKPAQDQPTRADPGAGTSPHELIRVQGPAHAG